MSLDPRLVKVTVTVNGQKGDTATFVKPRDYSSVVPWETSIISEVGSAARGFLCAAVAELRDEEIRTAIAG